MENRFPLWGRGGGGTPSIYLKQNVHPFLYLKDKQKQ